MTEKNAQREIECVGEESRERKKVRERERRRNRVMKGEKETIE